MAADTRCHVDAVYFWRDLQNFLFHVDRQVYRGVFQTVARNVFVCVLSSSIMVSNLRDMLVVVDTMFPGCVQLSPTARGIVGIRALGFVSAVQFGSPHQFSCGRGY